MDDEIDKKNKKVGYCSPPEHGKIKPGERRNPAGRRGKGKKTKTANEVPSDAEILARIDSEMIEYNGRNMTRREVEIRLHSARSMKGTASSGKYLEGIRQKSKAAEQKSAGGVLLVPGISEVDRWCIAAEFQQRQFREGFTEADRLKTPEDYMQEEWERLQAERAAKDED